MELNICKALAPYPVHETNSSGRKVLPFPIYKHVHTTHTKKKSPTESKKQKKIYVFLLHTKDEFGKLYIKIFVSAITVLKSDTLRFMEVAS